MFLFATIFTMPFSLPYRSPSLLVHLALLSSTFPLFTSLILLVGLDRKMPEEEEEEKERRSHPQPTRISTPGRPRRTKPLPAPPAPMASTGILHVRSSSPTPPSPHASSLALPLRVQSAIAWCCSRAQRGRWRRRRTASLPLRPLSCRPLKRSPITLASWTSSATWSIRRRTSLA